MLRCQSTAYLKKANDIGCLSECAVDKGEFRAIVKSLKYIDNAVQIIYD